MRTHSLIVSACLLLAAQASAETPCKDKADAKHDAHKALNDCITALRSGGTDDCSAKLNAYISAAKGYKGCRIEVEKKDAKQPCGAQRDANRAAHKAFHECLEGWTEDVSVHEADPTNTCTAELAAIAKSEKALATCQKAGKKKK